jgi:hypothetical protein
MSLVTLTKIKQMWKKLHARPAKDELIKMMKKLQLAVGEKKNKELQDEISAQLDDWEETLKEEEAKRKREEEVKKKGRDEAKKKAKAGEMEQVSEGSSEREPVKTKKQTAKSGGCNKGKQVEATSTTKQQGTGTSSDEELTEVQITVFVYQQ